MDYSHQRDSENLRRYAAAWLQIRSQIPGALESPGSGGPTAYVNLDHVDSCLFRMRMDLRDTKAALARARARLVSPTLAGQVDRSHGG
jgi:hypothetical protein